MDDCYSQKFNAVATKHGLEIDAVELPKDLRPDGNHAEKEEDQDDDDGDSVD